VVRGHGAVATQVNGDTNHNGQSELSELAAHIQTLAPKLSQERGKRGNTTATASKSRAAGAMGDAPIASRLADFKQKPRMGSRGEDFPLVKRLPAISAQ
jgi:hypothetical protein